MVSEKYIAVDAMNIELLQYEYSVSISQKPNIIKHFEGTAKEIFEKNGVPCEYQKLFMIANPISMSFQKINPSDNSLNVFKYHRFRAKEFLTGLGIILAFSKNGRIHGQQESNPSTFVVDKCYECSREVLISFMSQLKEKKLLDSYVKSMAETMEYRSKVSYELYEAQIKYYRDKMFKK